MGRICLCVLALGAALLGAAPAAAQKDKAPAAITVDRAKRTVTVPAKVAPRKINDPAYKGLIYPIEVIATYPFPRGKKAHETVVTIDVKPSDVHKALVDLGLKPGAPATEKANATGPEVKIFVEFLSGGRPTKRVPIERVLMDRRTEKPMPKVKWHFTGSARRATEPDVYQADRTGTLIAIFPVTDETVFQTNLTLADEKYVKLETDKKLLPPEGTAVNLVIVAPRAP